MKFKETIRITSCICDQRKIGCDYNKTETIVVF